MTTRVKAGGCLRRLVTALAGVCVCGVVVEGMLWCLGVWHTYARRERMAPGQGDVRILCVGDSFTVGMGAPGGESYPAHLQRLLDACATGRYVVVNAGAASQNTAQALHKLPEQLERYQPAAVVVLCGCANQWNKWGYGAQGSRVAGWLTRVAYRLRTWKLMQRLWRDVRDQRERTALAAERALVEAEHARLVAVWQSNASGAAAQKLGMFFVRERALDQACEWLREAVARDGSNVEARVYLAGALLEAGRRGEALAVLTNALALAPHDGRLWYRLGLLYSHEGQHTAALEAWLAGGSNVLRFAPLRECLKSMQRAFPAYRARIASALADVPEAGGTYDDPIMYQDYDFGARGGAEGAAEWACDDVERMIELSKECGAQVVVLTYPLRYQSMSETTANTSLNYHNRLHRLLAASARRKGAALVDMRAIFDAHHLRKSELLEPEGIGDHCTGAGYALMARQVFAALCAAGVVVETNAAPVRDAWLARGLPGAWRIRSGAREETTEFTAAGGWSAIAVGQEGVTGRVWRARGSWEIVDGVLRQHVSAGDVPAGTWLESALVGLTPSTITVRVRGGLQEITAERQP